MSGKSTQKKNITKAPKPESYFRFIFRKEQALDWAAVFFVVLLGCLLVTITFPYPRMSSDTYGYIWAAMNNWFTHLRPFGYSFFLQIVHVFSKSLYSIIVSQALIYAVSAGLLLLAVKKYWPPKKRWWFFVFEFVVVFSPVAFFLLDTVLSDVLQCALLFVIIAMLMVIIHERSWIALLLYAAALFCSFHTRYSSMYFPVAILPILAMSGKKIMRFASVGLTVAVFALFYVQTENNMVKYYGLKQFSTGFDGWQLANNGLHVIPFIDTSPDKIKIPEDNDLKRLHEFVLNYNYKHHKIEEYTNDGKKATASFIWMNDAPLKQYHIRMMRNDNDEDMAMTWVKLGSGLYKEYGKWLIVNYPWLFVKYYLLPNIKQVFFTTALEMHTLGSDIPAGKKEIVEWFDVPEDRSFGSRGKLYPTIFNPLYPWIELLTWIVFLASAVILLMVKKKGDLSKETKLSLWMIFLIGLVYYGTVTFASPIALRYWMPMHAVTLAFAWIAVTETLRIRASRAQR